MPQVDLPIEELREYRPQLLGPPDLGAFWERTLDDARGRSVPAALARAASPYRLVETYDVTFSGFGGDRIRGWLTVPAGNDEPLPVVVDYIGYGGGRGASHQFVTYALAGYAHFVVDNRGMGIWGAVGSTPDPAAGLGSAQAMGYMTRGLEDPEQHYLRRLICDAVLAIDAAMTLAPVDPDRVAVAGSSMGGGLSLAASALSPHVRAAMIDVPFLCHYPRAIRVADSGPYLELAEWLRYNNTRVEQVEQTMSYFDAAILGRSSTAPGLFSVGQFDGVCPPSTVFAAFHNYGGDVKEIRVYPFNGHEGGEHTQGLERFGWLRAHL